MRIKRLTIEAVSIADLAIAYASQTETECEFTHRDGNTQYMCGLRIHGMRRTQKDGVHLLDIEFNGDTNRPGEDAGDNCVWQKAKVRYNEFRKIGKVYWPRQSKKK